ncbi:MAG TPA: FAD:protein FMN transferase [Acidimicrobiales bacterium]|nr:FAD:protein FMN transferase [Acidimicrobiales bacterium]
MTLTGEHEVSEGTFAAMGCRVHVVVVGGPDGSVELAARRVTLLENLWSRFLPGSDVSRCNAAAGRATVVSPLTIALVRRAVGAWRTTGGRYDPTVLSALENLGYVDSFEHVPSSTPFPAAPARPAPGCAGIVVDGETSTVTVPAGVRFDAGGIGKGLAADLVAADLLAAGASGACVNLGGDLKAVGEPPSADGWTVGLEDPYDTGRELQRFAVADQGVATSSRTYRTWERAGAQVHHLIDPATGAPAWTDLASVTVVGATAWQAEILAKAAFVAGPVEGAALIARARATGLMVDDGGSVHALPGFTGEEQVAC